MVSDWIAPYFEADPIAVLALLVAVISLSFLLLTHLYRQKRRENFYRVLFIIVGTLLLVEGIPDLMEVKAAPRRFEYAWHETVYAVLFWLAVIAAGVASAGSYILALSTRLIQRFDRSVRTLHQDYRESDYTWYEPIDY